MNNADVQYISNPQGQTTAVIVPIELWHELISAEETAYLLSSDTMKQRLLNARQSEQGIAFDEVREKLGI